MFEPILIPRTPILILAACLGLMEGRGQATELRIGGATVSITPDHPVALWPVKKP